MKLFIKEKNKIFDLRCIEAAPQTDHLNNFECTGKWEIRGYVSRQTLDIGISIRVFDSEEMAKNYLMAIADELKAVTS